MTSQKLTPDQIKARAALIPQFRERLIAALWEAVEECPPELLASDDGTPYAAMIAESLRQSSLDQMVKAAASAACQRLERWL